MSKATEERTTALSLAIKPGESITIDGPTRIKLVRSSSGRADLVFIGPESTRINRRGYVKLDEEDKKEASPREKLSAASVCS
jgi:sRNA-binding carbon storage regulator CsrA